VSLLVKDVMSQNVITIDLSSPARQAAILMDKYDIGCLIVLNNGKAVGIVTERDMLTRVLLQCKDPETTSVSEIMSAPLISSDPDTSLREAMRLMNERKIKRVAVVEEGAPIGLLSMTDIVRSVAFLEHMASSLCARCRWNKNVSSETLDQSGP
jgi:CBS domain-containing protein